MSSSANSPNHRFSGTIDSFYDPDFTAEISNKMRVPEKISLSIEQFNDPAIIAAKKQLDSNDRPIWMSVPERILVMGNESHASGREQLPEMKLENSMHGMNGDNYNINEISVMTTPPQTLTLCEHNFPTVEQINELNINTNGPNSKSFKRKRNIALSGLTPNICDEDSIIENPTKDSSQSPDNQSFYNISVNDMSDDSAVLRRQVKNLSKRIAAIELENQHRHQREVVVYTIGVIYFIIKGIVWIHKQI